MDGGDRTGGASGGGQKITIFGILTVKIYIICTYMEISQTRVKKRDHAQKSTICDCLTFEKNIVHSEKHISSNDCALFCKSEKLHRWCGLVPLRFIDRSM